MIQQKRITTRLFCPFALFLLSFQPILSPAQRGVLLDQGGAIFNVKAYGATGDGKADDTPTPFLKARSTPQPKLAEESSTSLRDTMF